MCCAFHDNNYYAHGKLLLSGEYMVLEGALSLALPSRFGQRMSVSRSGQPGFIDWQSLDCHGAVWFSAKFNTTDFTAESIQGAEGSKIASRLSRLFTAIHTQKPDFLKQSDHSNDRERNNGSNKGWRIITQLEFERDWGLGSSSTLISLLAQWSGADPFALLFETFGGSGYDIACARSDGPLFYRKVQNQGRWRGVDFNPPFSESLYFVHLGRKQNTASSLKQFQSSALQSKSAAEIKRYINTIIHLSVAIKDAQNLHDFEQLLRKHESVISAATGMEPVASKNFPDYWGAVKSLGAWGGDFVLATSDLGKQQTAAYFAGRGLSTILTWNEMVLERIPKESE